MTSVADRHAVAGPSSAPTGWRVAWTPSRARLWLVAAAAAAWLPLLGVPLRGWLDFSAFYAAGSRLFTRDLVDLAPIVTFQAERGLPITPFVYPPAMALPYGPLALLPYGLAGAAHALLMLALLVTAALVWARVVGLPRRWAVLGALAWGPAAAGVASGQNTSLALLLLVLAGAALASGRQVAGGALAGLLAYKPQLGAPMLGLLVLRGRWAALGVASAVLGLHYLLGVVATGGAFDWPAGWVATLRAYHAEDFAANGWQAVSLPALATRLELAWGIPWLSVAGYVAAGLVVLACIPAMRRLPVPDAVALVAACGLVISPHAWVYDATLLLPGLAVVAARATRRGWPWRDRWWMAAAFAIALSWPLGGVVGLTAVPLLVLAVPAAILEVGPFRHRGTERQAPTGSLPLGQ